MLSSFTLCLKRSSFPAFYYLHGLVTVGHTLKHSDIFKSIFFQKLDGPKELHYELRAPYLNTRKYEKYMKLRFFAKCFLTNTTQSDLEKWVWIACKKFFFCLLQFYIILLCQTIQNRKTRLFKTYIHIEFNVFKCEF